MYAWSSLKVKTYQIKKVITRNKNHTVILPKQEKKKKIQCKIILSSSLKMFSKIIFLQFERHLILHTQPTNLSKGRLNKVTRKTAPGNI